MIRTWTSWLAVALLLAAPSEASSRTVSDITFAERVQVSDVKLELCSAALLRWKRIVKAYVAGLYLRSCADLSRPLSDVPRRLELSYLRGFDGPRFARAADTVLARTFSKAELSPLRERIDRLHVAYRRVETGDRYALTYVPGVGTELALNGERLALAPGADFAAAYFAIWLGPDPADARLRDELLAPSP